MLPKAIPRVPVGTPPPSRLTSWKDVAAYLHTSVRTVQRWEESERLPVHRHEHAKGGTIYAYPNEIDQWLESRQSATPGSRLRRESSDARPAEPVSASPESEPRRGLIVLPFRLVQSDSDIEYLSLAFADAITTSLSVLSALSVRSSLVASRYAGETDMKRIGTETAVDFIVSGTLWRSGCQLRISVQLVEAATATIVSSETMLAGVDEVFQLRDRVIAIVVDALALPMNAREQERLHEDAPRNPAAYEHYLRANELADDFYPAARDLYLRCVKEDPDFAPAWARLGRCCRITAKFGGAPENFSRAQSALARALELNPNLALAHTQLAYLEADSNLAQDGMVRLLDRAKISGSDPELFAGLVHVCRFCGLLDSSVAAHERAMQLDPTVRTSVCHTYLLLGDHSRALEMSREVLGYLGPLVLISVGRQEEAVALARRMEQTSVPLAYVQCVFSSARALAEGKRTEAIALTERAISLVTRGPEELFQLARHLAYLSEPDRALAILRRAVDEGFFCYPALLRDSWLHVLRSHPRFDAILNRALERHALAVRAFVHAGGERILGKVPALSRV